MPRFKNALVSSLAPSRGGPVATQATQAARTVRDTIPHSRLATYANYSYDEDRERLYTSEVSTPTWGAGCPPAGIAALT